MTKNRVKAQQKQSPQMAKSSTSPLIQTRFKVVFDFWQKFFYLLIFIAILVTSFIFVINLVFANKFYPQIYINHMLISGMTKDEASQALHQMLLQRSQRKIELSYQGRSYQLDLSRTYPYYEQTALDKILEDAYEYGRLKFYYKPVYLNLPVEIEGLDTKIKQIATMINEPAINSQLKFDGDQIIVTPSQEGRLLDEEDLINFVKNYLMTGFLPSSRELVVREDHPSFNYQTAIKIKNSLDKLRSKPLQFTFKSSNQSLYSFDLTFDRLVQILMAQSSPLPLSPDQAELSTFLNEIATQIEQPVKEPTFKFDGQKVTEFIPPQEGRKLDRLKTAQLITDWLLENKEEPIPLPVSITQPKNQLVNDFGIKDLLGEGISFFKGSIPNRIFNINLAASRLNGALVPPGATFSFNETIGEVSAATGYKSAYVIKSGRTVLDDGGGVCQVSTTLFRAVLKAGLPIKERVAHAYRVGYYEQNSPPGFDATVYAPSVDFKFVNDTPAHLLIQAYTQDNTLIVRIFGQFDGRVVEISDPVITDQTPPPPEIKQDDPTIPKGQVKQVEYPAWGARVIFTRKVTKDGQTLSQDTFRSVYRAWPAVFLIGTKEN